MLSPKWIMILINILIHILMKVHFDEFCLFCQRARTNSVYSRPMDNIGQPSQHFPMKGTYRGKIGWDDTDDTDTVHSKDLPGHRPLTAPP